ncbi:MAG: hypothetical protein AAB416_02805 [Patescibacteria group bacterium]
MLRRRRTIDLYNRTERRYSISDADVFISALSDLLEPVKFSTCCRTETIYFNTDEHIVPFETSIKARRYIPADHLAAPVLDMAVPYLLEIKYGSGDYKRKVRTHLIAFDELLQVLPKKYPTAEPLRPYIADTYDRSHYAVKGAEQMRITIDTGTTFYFFPPGESKSILLDRERIARVEVKEGKTPPKEIRDRINAALAQAHALPEVSKKFRAYALLRDYRYARDLPPLSKECKDSELEVKFTCLSEQIFFPIKEFFRDSRSSFHVCRACPWTIELSASHSYYRDEQGVYKIVVGSRDKPRRIRKSSSATVSAPKDSIIERKESKAVLSANEITAQKAGGLIGQFKKNKRRFLLEHEETGRLYAVTLDYCLKGNSRLTQLEIEYYGILKGRELPDAESKPVITSEIAEITRLLKGRFPQLIPTSTTKQEWLIK